MDTNSYRPLVSVVITSYNRARWIGQAIDSVLAQDYPNLEIIVSDNCSSDNTPEILKKYTADNRVKLFFNEQNIGMIPNFRLATEKRATGEFLTYVSSDDYLNNPSFISQAVLSIGKFPGIVLVAARNSTVYNNCEKAVPDASEFVFSRGFVKGLDAFSNFPSWMLPGWGGVLMHRQKLVELDIFSTRAQSLDYEANLKLMLQGNVYFINEPSYVFRKHPNNASGFMTFEAHINNLDFIENTFSYARNLGIAIDLDGWRKKVYRSYLNANCTALLKSTKEFDGLVRHIKKHKKIYFHFFNAPKFVINSFIYRNYRPFSALLRYTWPSKYHSIKKMLH